jgi:magnesium chelatase accessory protein
MMYERFYPTMDWAEHRHAWPHSAQSHFVNAGGIRWHVQRMGDGPVLLLLHGTGSGSFSWRGLMPLLSQHFQVIAPDLPGHAFTSRGAGDSLSLHGMAEGLRTLMLQMDITPTVIAGHSAGAAIAAHMVLHQGALAHTHLIGLNPAWLPIPGLPSWVFGPAAKLAALNPLSGWAAAKLANRPALLAKSMEQTGSQLDEEGMSLYRRVFGHPGHVHSVLAMMAAWKLQALSSTLHRIANPVSILVGSADKTVPPQLAQQACSLMPHVKLHLQHHLGHLAHEEDPQGTAALIFKDCGQPWAQNP